MAENDLKVIQKAKELATHGNCIKLVHSMDLYIEELMKEVT